jgi:DNA replication protein DnaC
MKELSEIITEIRQNTGVKRYKVELNNFENGVKYFSTIANTLLEPKGIEFDLSSTNRGVCALIEWLYMIEGTNKMNFNKGILFKGHTGRGKTFLFRVFSEFVKIDNVKFSQNGKDYPVSPRIVNARQISGEYQDPDTGGYRVIEKYSNMSCLVIDDIGSEQVESNNYGNKINVISEIISKREENSMLTFGTTNLNRMDSKGIYDDRTISRMNSLFNVININHDIDFRKSKVDQNEN